MFTQVSVFGFTDEIRSHKTDSSLCVCVGEGGLFLTTGSALVSLLAGAIYCGLSLAYLVFPRWSQLRQALSIFASWKTAYLSQVKSQLPMATALDAL